jgi:hypothetical protein
MPALRPATARAQEQRPSVVFRVPHDLSPKVRAALEDALTTQLSLIQTSLRYEMATEVTVNPSERLQAAKAIAATSGAIGVFWLEAAADAPWLLYAVDARADRMIVRRLAPHAKGAEPEADIEAVALIVRATTQALLHGEPLPSSSPSLAPDKPRDTSPWPVELLDAGHSALRLAVSYVGTTFAKQRPWQSGFALRGAWLFPSGPYVGLGFSLMFTSKFTPDPVHFEIDRYPFSLHAGLRFGFSRLTFIGELGAELEVRRRRTLWAANLEPNRDQKRIVYNICPKLETELALVPWFVMFASAGLDIVIGNFAYSVPMGVTIENKPILVPVLEPHWIRLTLQIGIAIIR